MALELPLINHSIDFYARLVCVGSLIVVETI